jgi:hypothetical protein
MKIFAGALLPCFLGVGSVLAGAPLSSVQRVTSLPILTNKFIVEVATVGDIPSKRSLTSVSIHIVLERQVGLMHVLSQPHEALYRSLEARGVGFTVIREFKAEGLFVGAALTLSVRPMSSVTLVTQF